MSKITIRQRKPFEKKYGRLFKKALREQLNAVLTVNDYTNIEERINRLVKEKPIREVFIKLYPDVGVYFGNKQRQGLKSSHKIIQTKQDEFTDIWARSMESYALNEAGARITWITEASKDLILNSVRKSIAQVQAEGLGISQATDIIEKDLIKRYGAIERWRAMRIANTEVLTASNKGAEIGAKSLGIPMTKTWLTGGVNIRDTHAEANGQTVNSIDADFNIGGFPATRPGDPRLPAGEVINCKCTVIYEPI